jgi:hypothetical protein
VRFIILEKFLFQQEEDYHYVAELLNKKNIMAWVNCPRRLYPGYIELKKRLHAPMVINIVGSNWGLACNSIHWLDLFCWLTESTSFTLFPLLDEGIVPAKRPGYIEINGSIVVEDSGNRMFINCFSTGNHPLVTSIASVDQDFEIHEADQKICSMLANTVEKQVVNPFKILKQSELTHLICDDLLTTGSCSLPLYNFSMNLHVALLKLFLHHHNTSLNLANNKICAIT